MGRWSREASSQRRACVTGGNLARILRNHLNYEAGCSSSLLESCCFHLGSPSLWRWISCRLFPRTYGRF